MPKLAKPVFLCSRIIMSKRRSTEMTGGGNYNKFVKIEQKGPKPMSDRSKIVIESVKLLSGKSQEF